METFAANVRRRAEALGLSQAEVARRTGLSERRFAHYASGKREPGLAILVRIASVLATTVDDLLGRSTEIRKSKRLNMLDRLSSVAAGMSDADLELVVVQAEAVARFRRKAKA